MDTLLLPCTLTTVLPGLPALVGAERNEERSSLGYQASTWKHEGLQRPPDLAEFYGQRPKWQSVCHWVAFV